MVVQTGSPRQGEPVVVPAPGCGAWRRALRRGRRLARDRRRRWRGSGDRGCQGRDNTAPPCRGEADGGLGLARGAARRWGSVSWRRLWMGARGSSASSGRGANAAPRTCSLHRCGAPNPKARDAGHRRWAIERGGAPSDLGKENAAAVIWAWGSEGEQRAGVRNGEAMPKSASS
uniref:Uncharacterized protein n=1 Tax=Arundo donax TaxID=35708 RepID=A0A0A9BPD5_ARUDO